MDLQLVPLDLLLRPDGMRHFAVDQQFIGCPLDVLLVLWVDDQVADVDGIALQVVLSQVGNGVARKCLDVDCPDLDNLTKLGLNCLYLLVFVLAQSQAGGSY